MKPFIYYLGLKVAYNTNISYNNKYIVNTSITQFSGVVNWSYIVME